jgi:hypothetical protein
MSNLTTGNATKGTGAGIQEEGKYFQSLHNILQLLI